MNDETQDYCRYWGKVNSSEDDDLSFHLLPYHCLDVAAMNRELLRNDMFPAYAGAWIKTHDAGTCGIHVHVAPRAGSI